LRVGGHVFNTIMSLLTPSKCVPGYAESDRIQAAGAVPNISVSPASRGVDAGDEP